MAAKILGAIVGLIVGLLAQSWWAAGILSVVGFVIGHFLGQAAPGIPSDEPRTLADLGLEEAPAPSPPAKPKPAKEPEEPQARARELFADHLCALFAAVARADGDAVRDEVRVVREYFGETLRFSAMELDRVRIGLKRALDGPVDIARASAACREQLPPGDRLLLLDALYELALADGNLRRAERDVLERVAGALEITAEEHRSVRALHFPEGEAQYAKLGLDPAATDDEVKTAFRKLAAAHHPDRVAHLGPGAVAAASERFREIKDAYDAIRQLRGL